VTQATNDIPTSTKPGAPASPPADAHAPRERRLKPVHWFIGLMAVLVLVAAGFLGGTMFALNEESSTAMRVGVVAVAILAPISMLVWLLLRLRPKVKTHGSR
jgi:hypothetical protein